jgi:hypothetical protein
VTAPIPTTEPATIIAGDTTQWLKSLANYPASAGWLLGYTLVNAAQRYTFSASAMSDNYLVNIAAATTSAYVAGNYDFRAAVSKAGEVFTVSQGRMAVTPAFGVAVDARSQARRTLEAIEATLEGRASSATAEYEVAGRKLRYIPIPELLQLRDRLRGDVAGQDAAAAMAKGLGNPNRIYVRFGA